MINIIFCSINLSLVSVLLIFSNIKCESESTQSDTKDESNNDRKRYSSSPDFWMNHKPYYNYVYNYANNAKNVNREAKSNNEPYFTDPNSGDGYESMQPSTIQITAIPGGLGPGGLGGPLLPAQMPSLSNPDLYNPFNLQKFPVFVINKSKSDGIMHFKWLIPILLLLGAPLLCGLIFIPIILQSIFFFMTIVRNLGILLPLLPAITGITGINGNGGNPIIPTTG